MSNCSLEDPMEIAEAYNTWSRTYDTCPTKTRDLDGKVFQSQVFDLVGKNVVEFGCGTGRDTHWILSQHGTDLNSYFAMDFSEGMLKQTKARIEDCSKIHPSVKDKLKLFQHDITKSWPLKEELVDFIFGNLVLEHVKDLSPIFQQVSSHLKPRGTLFLCEFHPFKQYEGRKAVFRDMNGVDVADPASFHHDISEFIMKAQGFGFNLVRIQEWRDDPLDKSTTPRLISMEFLKTGF